MSAALNHRHGHHGAEAGRQRRRRQRRWNSDQRYAVGSERTRRRYSRLTWQNLRRTYMVHIHNITTALRSVHAVVQPIAPSTRGWRGRRMARAFQHGACNAQPTSAAGERSQQLPHALHSCSYHSNGEPTTPAR
jgi:hypothetical protein